MLDKAAQDRVIEATWDFENCRDLGAYLKLLKTDLFRAGSKRQPGARLALAGRAFACYIE
ncbi:MAG: hypothetical protein IPG61_15880 [bacterium]|nr:hypothetical protein [bacterium]